MSALLLELLLVSFLQQHPSKGEKSSDNSALRRCVVVLRMVLCEGDAFSKALLRLRKEIGPLLRVIDILRQKGRPQTLRSLSGKLISSFGTAELTSDSAQVQYARPMLFLQVP